MSRFEGQVAVVTGAGTGMGRASALRLASEGAKVMVTGIPFDKLVETVELITEAGGIAEAYEMDVTDKEAINGVIDQIKNRHGRIDMLYSNAGNVETPTLIENKLPGDFEKVVAVHLMGAVNVTAAIVPVMKQNNYGRIVLCSSVADRVGLYGNHAYSAVKAGMVGYMHALCKETGEFGINVNCVLPGIVKTDMGAVWTQFPEVADKLCSSMALGRFAEAEEIANVVAFLLSKEASYVTGLSCVVDGGFSISVGEADLLMKNFINGNI